MSFVHLHVHTKYSLREGIISIHALVRKAAALGMKALAITDCENAYGIYKFYKECIAHHIKPIIGCEIYLGAEKQQLVLLVKNQTGFRNYSELLSLPYIEWEHLQKYWEGLICLSGNNAGEMQRLLADNKYMEAKRVAGKYKKLFGEDYYLEVQDHCLAEQKTHNQQLKEIGHELDIELVATNDVHYLNKEDAYLQEVFMAFCDQKKMSSSDRHKFISEELYLKSVEEMQVLFSKENQWLANTVVISDKIDFNFSYQNYLPKVSKQDPDRELAGLVSKRIFLYYQNTELLKAKARAEQELETIKILGCAEYFLIVHNYVDWALAKNIVRGPGRGAAAGSIINYILGITAVDPLAHGLIFERFINSKRISLPYIAIDVSLKDRDKVIEYIFNRYGAENTTFVSTINEISAMYALRNIANTLLYPQEKLEPVYKLNKASIPSFFYLFSFIQPNKALLKRYKSDKSFKKVIDIVDQIIGLPISAGTHAAGVAIANTNLKNIIPLTADLANLQPRTQLPIYDLASLGVLSIDIIGLRILDIIDKSEKHIRQNYNNRFSINNITFDDQATFQLLQKGYTVGCFQLESVGLRKVIKKLKPDKFSDVTAILSMNRPDPLEIGLLDKYIARKQGKEKYKLLFPELKPYLDETYGLILYQEQLMRVANTVGGFSMIQADDFRRVLSKRNLEKVAELKIAFLQGAKQNGFNRKKAEKLFKECVFYAQHTFNKAHAVSFGILSYQCAYLKAHYPTEYMAAVLDVTRMLTPELEKELYRLGIKVNGYAYELLREWSSIDVCIKIIPQGGTIIADYEL